MSHNWLFEIGSTYKIALSTQTYGGNVYAGVVDAESFVGLPINRIKYEHDTIQYSDLSFKILDNAAAYDVANIDGETIIVRFVEDGTQVKSWRFVCETAVKAYKQITVACVDYLSTLLDGVWPNTDLIVDLFPESKLSNVDENACVPVVFGTESYIPLQSISDTGAVYYILGEVAANTFTITRLTSPHAIDGQAEYVNGVDFTDSQSTAYGLRLFRPSISGSYRFWRQGADRVPPLVKYSDSDYSSYTNPVEILKVVLKQFGAVDGDFDSTWTTAISTIASRGISYSKGYYQHQDRKDILLGLLVASDVTLTFGEQISCYVNSKTSVDTLTSADIIRSSWQAEGSFSYSKIKKSKYECGYINCGYTNTPQDKPVKIRVTASTSTLNPSDDVLDMTGLIDTQDAQGLGSLYFQKKYNCVGEVSFKAHPDHITRRIGEVITISDTLYGTLACVIDQMKINRDSTIDFTCSTYSPALKDFADFAPSTVTPSNDTATGGISVLSTANAYTDDAVADIEAPDLSDYALIADIGALGWLDYVRGTTLATNVPDADDIFFNKNYIGFYDASEADFPVYISRSGTFRFSGNATNYIGWNGSTLASRMDSLIFGASQYISLLSDGYINVESGGDINIKSGGALNIQSGGDLNIQSGGDLIIDSDGDLFISSGGDLIIESGGGVTVQSGGGVTIQDGGDLILESTSTNTAFIDLKSTISGYTYHYYLYPVTYGGYTGGLVIRPSNISTGIMIGDFNDGCAFATLAAGDGTYYTTLDTMEEGVDIYIYGSSSTALYGFRIDSFVGLGKYLGTATYQWARIYGTRAYVTNGLFGGGSYYSSVACLSKSPGTGSSYYPFVGHDVDGYGVYSVNDDGTVWCAGTYTGSSEAYKENIELIQSPIMASVLKLKPKKYNYISDNKIQIGLTTEDTSPIFPELCSEFSIPEEYGEKDEETGDRKMKLSTKKGLNYAGIGPIAIKAIQEHQDYFDALTERIETLEKEIFKNG